MLDIKEDIREECAKLGDVTNVVLYDKEPDGIASVRYSTPEAAEACVKVRSRGFLPSAPWCFIYFSAVFFLLFYLDLLITQIIPNIPTFAEGDEWSLLFHCANRRLHRYRRGEVLQE